MTANGDSYHFGNVHGPVNAGSGQQYVAGHNQTVQHADHQRLLAEVTSLRQAINELRLTAHQRESAEGELEGFRQALDSEEPDREGAARHLMAFTAGLRDAGVLAAAGASLIGALSSLAHWLGPSGASVLALL